MGDALPVYHFGHFQLDPGERRLLRSGEPISLPPKPFDLLVTLVEHRGHLVEKATLIQALWPDTIVEEANLTFQVFTLRKVLDEDGNGDSMIQTVPTKGYRFVAPVSLKGQTSPERRTTWTGRSVAALFTLGCIGAIVGLMSRECDSQLPVPSEVRPLTTLPGYELAGSLSPDGQTVAFLWDGGKDEPLHLYVKRVDSSAIRRVTSGPDPESAAAWSPDGQQLAYLRFRESIGRVHVVSVADGADHTVSDFTAARFAGIDWSPDGRTLVAAQWRQNVDGSPIGGLHLIPVQGGEPRQITWPERWEAHKNPAFSRDGRSIAFVSCKGNECDAYVVALNADLTSAATPRRLTSQAGWAMTRLTWTHDGAEIIYDVFTTPSVISLWRVAVDGVTPPRRIESAGFRAHAPMVARDSDRLVFTRNLEDLDIYRLQVGEVPDKWFTSSFSDDSPQYSQDGKRVVFATSSSGISEEIWIAEADGSNPHQLTHGPGRWQGSPRFSPDGTLVAFDSCCSDGHVHLWTIDTDGGTPRQLTTSKTSDQNIPVWSADGSYIFFTDDRDGHRNLWRLRSSGGQPERVTTIGTGLAARVSSDGQNVLYQREDGDLPLMLLNLNGGPPRELVPCVILGAFAERAGHLYYATCPKGHELDSEIHVRDERTGSDRVLGNLAQFSCFPSGLAVSPDERTILYERVSTNPGSDLVLIDHFR